MFSIAGFTDAYRKAVALTLSNSHLLASRKHVSFSRPLRVL